MDGVIIGPSCGDRWYGRWLWYDISFTVSEFLYLSWKKTKQKSGTCWPISLKESLSTDTGRVHENLAIVITYLHWWFISKVSSSDTTVSHRPGVKKSKS